MKKKVLIFVGLLLALLLLGMKVLSHKHEYGQWIVKVNATEETEGLKIRRCKECGEEEQQIIPALPHVHDDETIIIKEPTCVSTGILKTICKKCGEEEELEIDVDKQGHKFSDWVEVPEKMTDKTGTKTRTCTLCNFVEEKEHEHELIEWEIIEQETCIKEGKIQSTCIHCSYTSTETVPTGDHTYSEWEILKEATCKEKGKAKRTCIHCGVTEETELALDETAHKYGEWNIVKPETTTTTGLKNRKCSICGYIDQVVIPIHVHDLSDFKVLVESTCSKGGSIERKCKTCDYKVTEELEPDESLHKFGEWTTTKEATCTEAGQRKHTCTVCNKDVFEILPKIDHDLEYDSNTKPGYLIVTCKKCDYYLELIDKPNEN